MGVDSNGHPERSEGSFALLRMTNKPPSDFFRGDQMIRSAKIRTVVRSAAVLAALATLGACAESHQRAWANGRAMVNSRAYDAMLTGSMDPQMHRRLTEAASPLRTYYRDLPYQPFARWW